VDALTTARSRVRARSNDMDALIAALRDEQDSGQPDKPEYVVGASTDGAFRFLSVNRVATNDQPGFECATVPISGERRFMVVMPHNLVPWAIGALGAYLTDDEWDEAARERDDEIAIRSEV
jgi:hypothetical protein